MTTPYTIPHTAQNISDAITQVVNADSTPQSPSQNMVTSEGVKAYVDGAVTGLTTNSFAATTLVEEQDAIASNDNDDTIPTSAAVIDYVNSTKPLPYAICSGLNISSSNQFNNHVYDTLWTVNGTLNVSQSGGYLTLPTGVYMVREQWRARMQSGGSNYSFYIRLRTGTPGNETTIVNHEATQGGNLVFYETNSLTSHVAINNDVRTENVYSYIIDDVREFQPTLQFVKIG
jgi:hypothetical protein